MHSKIRRARLLTPCQMPETLYATQLTHETGHDTPFDCQCSSLWRLRFHAYRTEECWPRAPDMISWSDRFPFNLSARRGEQGIHIVCLVSPMRPTERDLLQIIPIASRRGRYGIAYHHPGDSRHQVADIARHNHEVPRNDSHRSHTDAVSSLFPRQKPQPGPRY